MNGVLCTNIQNIINLAFVFVSVFTSDKLGRKTLLSIGSFICFVSLSFAACFVDGDIPQVAVYSCFLYIAAFEISFGPIT